jgi:CRISPR-associated endonuclease/helicase Cas3
MANIDPLVETAIALYNSGAPDNYFLHLCVYHSQHPLLVRSDMEQVLDSLLNRKDPFSLFQHSEIRKALDGSEEENHLFIIMATPVAEVGRDHDYDWAVVEPSSMRSIIQLAGRVRRHRTDPCSTPNLILLDVNVNHLKSSKRGPAYCRPGFESEHFPLESHHLTQLFRPGQLDKVDATSRIQESACPEPRTNLADLEHERLNAVMIGGDNDDRPRTIPVHWWWTTRAHLCGELQREQPFRFDSLGRQRFILLPDEDSLPHFHRVEDDGTTTSVDNLLHRREVYQGPRMAFWGEPDYIDALEKLAVELNMETDECAFRFGGVELPARGTEQGWYYTPALGFSRFK